MQIDGDGEDEDPQAHTKAALAAFGLKVELEPAPPLPEFHLWPENLQPFSFFLGLATQWRVGSDGATGMDYQVVRSEIERKEGRSARRSVAERRTCLFRLVVAMEGGALDGWREGREERDERERERAAAAGRR